MRVIQTLIADDHTLFCDGLEKVLSESGYFHVVKKFNSGAVLLENIHTLAADLLLLDIELRDLNGLDILRKIRLSDSVLKVVILSMHEESVFSKEAQRAGANGYLGKSIESSSMIHSLLEVMQGASLFPVSQTAPRTKTVRDIISSQETRILKLIAEGKTSTEISIELRISALTVKAHRRNMLRKLQVESSASMVSKAFAMGLI
jgi:DNA-binding NarL/FixJ family response regulator